MSIEFSVDKFESLLEFMDRIYISQFVVLYWSMLCSGYLVRKTTLTMVR